MSEQKKIIPLNERAQWFKEARFGLFIHLGLYSQIGRGEWVMFREGIPKSEYVKLVDTFKPDHFDAKSLVTLAKRAGHKYITMGTKHHEGFCLFKTAYTDYQSLHSPCNRDLIAEMAEACKEADMPLFFYFSLMDWYHPAYEHSIPKGTAISAEFINVIKGQLTELCTQYGKIAGIWFDGDWDHTQEQWRSEELVDLIYTYQPYALVNNRLGGYQGDFSTPEQHIDAHQAENGTALFEACMTINDNWGYTPCDQRHKSGKDLIQMLAMAAGNDTNLLLNVGPKPGGTIQEEHVRVLEEMGAWLEMNGESIYGTRGAYITYLANTSTTRNANRYFFHVFHWHLNTSIRIDLDIREPIQRVYVLETNEEIPYIENTSVGEGLSASTTVSLINKKWNPIDTVIVVEVKK